MSTTVTTGHGDEPSGSSAIWRKTNLEELLAGSAALRSVHDLAIKELTDEEADAAVAALHE